MTGKITSLVAATILSACWAGGAAAAPTDRSNLPTTAVAAAAAQASVSGCKTTKGLYDRLGGIFGIAKVVDLFSDAIITDPALLQNPALVAWNTSEKENRLPGLKVMRTIWIASMVGGPFKFTGLPLETAHADLNLTAAEFNAVGAQIVAALRTVGAAQADIDQLVCLYNTSMGDVVSAADPLQAVKPRN